MTVVSTKEFNANLDKYLDMAIENEICIKKENKLFFINYKPVDEPDVIFQPDNDFYRSITAEELLERIYGDIDRKFENRIK